MNELNKNTILNGKYVIENKISYVDACYKYKATDLVMREDVYIYEFCPQYINERNENSDKLSISAPLLKQFSKALEEFETNVSEIAHGKKTGEIAKNYFRENNTGYLVTTENKKDLKKKKLILKTAFGILIAIMAIEIGILATKHDKNDIKPNNENIITEESIEQLIGEEEIKSIDKTNVTKENIDEDIETNEDKKQYSEEELLSMIQEKSEEVLWGSYDTEENENIIEKLRLNIGNEYMLWSPSEGYKAMLYDDFDGDGYKEMFALMCKFDESMFYPSLWFTDGNIVENLTYPEIGTNGVNDIGDDERTCAGLFAIQFGKKRIAQIVFVDAWYRADINSAYQYVYENGDAIQAGPEGKALVLLNDEEFNVLGLNMYTNNIYFMEDINEIDKDLFSNFSSKHINMLGLETGTGGGICYDDYIVYYKDGDFYEYATNIISEDEAEKTYDNFKVEKERLEKNLKKIEYSYAPGYAGEVHKYGGSTLKSIYLAENDKLYLNYIIKGQFEDISGATMEYGGHKYENGVTTFEVSFCYSINDNQLELYSAYVGERGEKSDLFD